MTIRTQEVSVMNWGIAHSSEMVYTENLNPKDGPLRSAWLAHVAYFLPFYGDCSSWSVAVAKWSGVSPAMLAKLCGSDWVANTTIFLAAAQQVTVAEVQPGDFALYGPGGGVHMAPIIQGGSDPLTVSHGHAGVDVIHVSQGCPPAGYVKGKPMVRYLRITPPTVAQVVKTVAKKVVTAPFVAIATLIKSPVTVASSRKLSPAAPVIVDHPNGGEAVCYVSENIWQGIPSQAEKARLLAVKIKPGTVSAAWWKTAKQVAW